MKRIKDTKAQRIELLKKYYPVDTEKKVVTFKLYYDHASELLDYTVGETGKEMFKDEFLDKVSSILNKIPVGYKADLILEIKDYDVYSEEVILEKFNDLIELNSYDALRISKKNCFIAASLFLVGCTILIINALLTTLNAFGEGTIIANVVKETVDITSWVFIWQAVTFLFLSPSQESQYIIDIFYKLNSLSMSRNGTIVVSENNDDLSDKCQIDSSFSKIQKQVLAIAATILIFESLVMLLTLILLIISQAFTNIPLLIFEIVISLLTLIDGCLSLTKFTNRRVGRKRFIFFYGLTLLAMLGDFIYCFFTIGDWSEVVNQIFVIVILAINFVLCFFWDTLGFKKKKVTSTDKIVDLIAGKK